MIRWLSYLISQVLVDDILYRNMGKSDENKFSLDGAEGAEIVESV